MPRGDGTGPFGMGAGRGRGRGWYAGFSYMGRRFGGRRIGIIGSLIPIAAAVVRDMTNHNGILRSFGRKLITKKQTENREPVQAQYTVVEESEEEKKNSQKR